MQFGFVDILLVLLVVSGPTKALAYFAAKAGRMSLAERRTVGLHSVAVATVILLVFALLGPRIIGFFHVSVPALELAGGAILFVFALRIVLGESGHHDSEDGGADIAIYPMAMPLIASPQGIVAIVVIISRAQDLADRVMIVLAVLVTMAINVAVFWAFASAAGKSDAAKKPSVAGEVILRVVSIMLAGLAVQLMILGLRDLGVLPAAAPHG